ncbi:DUF5325 family protein [Piscibacillus halophilus]|uniref:Uncharacterized protein n=1 Tax=Piscibacillus halophilus TaxID=571933 RepID=A0A1H9MN02_9BACI|nr:DUF5325 family protein [Piscibacillus halophilus]SER24533.1 hypothetical protein SAMN05216362_1658 [Piscibacillus halophilus]
MSHNVKMFLLAVLVVLCFVLAAIVISYRNYFLLVITLLAGFGLMGYGLTLKRKHQEKN